MDNWLGYALLTMMFWGTYGVLLHQGAITMSDPDYGRVKAFLFVGIAYFLTAVLAPLALLWMRGASMDFQPAGMGWALAAGTVGAIGAFGVLLAFGSGGRPSVVMTIIFAGAPIINAIISITKAGLWGEVRWQVFVGIALAVVGAALVTTYKPSPVPHAPAVDAVGDAGEPVTR